MLSLSANTERLFFALFFEAIEGAHNKNCTI